MDRDAWLQRLMENADKCREAGALACERQALREIGLAMSEWYPAGRQELNVKTLPSQTPLADILSTPAGLAAFVRMAERMPAVRAALVAKLTG